MKKKAATKPIGTGNQESISTDANTPLIMRDAATIQAIVFITHSSPNLLEHNRALPELSEWGRLSQAATGYAGSAKPLALEHLSDGENLHPGVLDPHHVHASRFCSANRPSDPDNAVDRLYLVGRPFDLLRRVVLGAMQGADSPADVGLDEALVVHELHHDIVTRQRGLMGVHEAKFAMADAGFLASAVHVDGVSVWHITQSGRPFDAVDKRPLRKEEAVPSTTTMP